jgi:hypothetical protein
MQQKDPEQTQQQQPERLIYAMYSPFSGVLEGAVSDSLRTTVEPY